MLIVDDVYFMAGSPNLNQRSLDGKRDTEIAVGCWQPNLLHQNEIGGVHHFRISLWLEHFKLYDPVFETPGTLECVRKVKELSGNNFEQYAGPDGSVPQGHILCYPFRVQNDGRLLPWEGATNSQETTLAERIFGGDWVEWSKTWVVIFSGYDPHILTT